MILGIGGMGILLYSLSAVTAFLVRRDVRRIRKRAWLMNEISGMDGHIIACGVGTTGRHVVSELDRSGAEFVLIDPDPEVAKNWPKRPVLTEDATHEATLEKAGIKRAKGEVVRVEEVEVGDGSMVAGKRLEESKIHDEAGLTVIALKKPKEEQFTYNPGPDEKLEPGTVVLVIGSPDQPKSLARLAGGRA